MKVCIYSQQKTGSTSLYYMFRNNKYDVDKRHYNYNAIRDIYYDIIIIPLRNIKDIIISGYFENVTKKKFYLDISKNHNDILKLPIEKHIENILNYNWNKDNHYTIRGIERTLRDIFDINITEIKFDNYKIIEKDHKKLNKKTKIVLCNFVQMNTEQKKQMFSDLEVNINNINFHTNIGEKKWYKNIYTQTKILLKNENFDDLYDIDFTSDTKIEQPLSITDPIIIK